MNEIIIWDECDIKKYNSPLVYIFWKDDVALYVGMSSLGIERPVSSGHHAKNARKQATKIEFRIMDSASDAFQLEQQLILDLKPPFNNQKAAQQREWLALKQAEKLGIHIRR